MLERMEALHVSEDVASRLPKAVFDAMLLLRMGRHEMAAVKFEKWAEGLDAKELLPEEPAVEWLGEVLTLRQETKVGRGARDGTSGCRRLFDSGAFKRCVQVVSGAAVRVSDRQLKGGFRKKPRDDELSEGDRRVLEVFAQLRRTGPQDLGCFTGTST